MSHISDKHQHDPNLIARLTRRRQFLRRLLTSMLFTLSLVFISLGLGMWGYHKFGNMSWIDAFVNASMILSGMGPVSPLESDSSKLFAGLYALYCGGTFLIAMAVVLAPVLHYMFKSFELDTQDNTKSLDR